MPQKQEVPETFVFVPRTNVPTNAKPLAIYSTQDIPVIIGDAEDYRKQLEELLLETDADDTAVSPHGEAAASAGDPNAGRKKPLKPLKKGGSPTFEISKQSKKERNRLNKALPPFPPGVDASDALIRPADAVEYHIDEEDDMFLRLLNCDRHQKHRIALTEKPFELLMDYFEKADELQVKEAIAKKAIDEDAVCCVCFNGDSYDMNAIMFCDLCNMAVHQECYGVPYLPEGQWLCRKCLQSPSKSVQCVLCPNEGGAFKRTDDNRWCHIVCALWIPEVEFVNTVFLEPITGIAKVEKERWKLRCEVCKQQSSSSSQQQDGDDSGSSGACIQCCVKNCIHAYHVTCAQEAGYHLEIKEAPPNTGHLPRYIDGIEKTTYCKLHSRKFDKLRTPPGKRQEAQKRRAAEMKRDLQTLHQMLLTNDRMKELTPKLTELNENEREEFIQEIHKYWQLKREARSGVPLLRRLVVQTQSSRIASEMLLLNMRRSFDRFRHLCDLLDRHQRDPSILERLTLYDFIVDPVGFLLRGCVRKIRQLDLDQVFVEPVPREVPGYYELIQHPISLHDMDDKVERGEYTCVEDLRRDFKLMIDNCKTFNPKDHPYHALAEFIDYTSSHDIFARALRTEKALLTRKAPRTFKSDVDAAPNLHFVQDVFLNFLKEFEPDFAAEFEKQLEKEGRLSKPNQSVLGSVMAALNRSIEGVGPNDVIADAGGAAATGAEGGTAGDQQSVMSMVSSAALDGTGADSTTRRRPTRGGAAAQPNAAPLANGASARNKSSRNDADEALVFRRPHDIPASPSRARKERSSSILSDHSGHRNSSNISKYYADDDTDRRSSSYMNGDIADDAQQQQPPVNPREQPFTRFLPSRETSGMSPPSFNSERARPDELKTNKIRMEPLPASLSNVSLKRRPSPSPVGLSKNYLKKDGAAPGKNGGRKRVRIGKLPAVANGLPNLEDGLTSTTTNEDDEAVHTNDLPSTDDFNTSELDNSDVNKASMAFSGSSQLQPGGSGSARGAAVRGRRSQRSAAVSASARLKLSTARGRKLLLEELEPHDFVWVHLPASTIPPPTPNSKSAAAEQPSNEPPNNKTPYPAVIRMTPRAAKGTTPASVDATALEGFAKQMPNGAAVRELLHEVLINSPQRLILNRRDDSDRYLVCTFHKAPQWHWVPRADIQRMFSETQYDRSIIQQSNSSSNAKRVAGGDTARDEDSVEAAHRRAAQLKDLIVYAGSEERDRAKERRDEQPQQPQQQNAKQDQSTQKARGGRGGAHTAKNASTAAGSNTSAATSSSTTAGGTPTKKSRNPRSRSPSKSRGASVSTATNAQ